MHYKHFYQVSVLKCGKNLPGIKTILGRLERENGARVYAVSDCGLETERVYRGAGAIPETGNYMTTVIVKQ